MNNLKNYFLFVLLVFVSFNCWAQDIKKGDCLTFEIRYAKHVDLVYHVMNYMHVNNASNIYNPEYVKKMDKIRGSKLCIPEEMEDFYNRNFQKLNILGFMIYNYNDIESYNSDLLKWQYFSDEEREYFIKPFVHIIEQEKDFYYSVWEKQYKKTEKIRRQHLDYMIKRFKPYEPYFQQKGDKAVIYLSYSLAVNGRGIYGENEVKALAPFPNNKKEMNHAFYQLFHEFTHQLTDSILQGEIRMDDDSHMLTEKMVILEDYYLIEKAGVDDLSTYYPEFGMPKQLKEEMFLQYMKVPEEIDTKLKALLR